jgi:hypothetical protein
MTLAKAGLTIMADVEQMLTRREAIADEITQAIGRVGVLVREEKELTDDLRRALSAASIKTEPFATQPNFAEAICAELSRTGLNLHRADPRISLNLLVAEQNRRTRGLLATKAA